MVIVNIRIDHKNADISKLERSFHEMDRLFIDIQNNYSIQDYILLKTCNRAEMYLIMDECVLNDLNCDGFVVEYDDDAMRHILRLASGLESMIIGEDQILGQIKDAQNKRLKIGNNDEAINILFTKAIHVGQLVRSKTHINRGSISIGSAAVELAESVHGNLNCKNVLIIGAGEMGTLVAKALAEKNLRAIVVANRTYDRAIRLAKELGGSAIHFDKLDGALCDADVVISATGAPHPILTYEKVKKVVSQKNLVNLVMVDIANPRDIEEEVANLGVKLFNIDDLREIADKNKKIREQEAYEAEKIIEKELKLLKKSLKYLKVEPLISSIRNDAENIRINETKKALKMLGDLNGRERVVNDLTKVIINKIFYDVINNIKNAAENDDNETIDVVKNIFKKFN
jgi:glutamyl-tRNA reductase